MDPVGLNEPLGWRVGVGPNVPLGWRVGVGPTVRLGCGVGVGLATLGVAKAADGRPCEEFAGLDTQPTTSPQMAISARLAYLLRMTEPPSSLPDLIRHLPS